MAILETLGALGGAIGSIGLDVANAGVNIFDQWRKNRADERSYKLATNQFGYQQQMDALNMQREDTAYQRAAADMRAAGLNPLSGANPAQATVGTAGNAGSYAGTSGGTTPFTSHLIDYLTKKTELEQEKTIADERNKEAARHNAEIESILRASQKDTASKTPSIIRLNEAQANEQERSTNYKDERNIDDSTPDEVKIIREAQNEIKQLTAETEKADAESQIEEIAYQMWRKAHPGRAMLPGARLIWNNWGDKKEALKFRRLARQEYQKQFQGTRRR